MYAKRFEPIAGKGAEIIEYLMTSPDMPDSQDLQFKIRLAIEEIVENIVRYAYENGSGYLEASTEVFDGHIRITFADAGKPFNPLDKDDPDITLSAEDRAVGGLGIFLCKQLMDNVIYEFKEGRNTLTLIKKINFKDDE